MPVFLERSIPFAKMLYNRSIMDQSPVGPRKPLWKRILNRIVIYAVVIYLGFCLIALVFQKNITYHPEPSAPEEQVFLDSYPWLERVRFSSSDGIELHAVWVPPPEGRPVLIFSHGNAGNLLGRMALVQKFRDQELGIFLYDYRGYGQSQGSPSEEGLYLDSEAAWEWVSARGGIDPERIVSYGRSLGAAVALHLALSREVAGVILEVPFTSIRDMAKEVLPFFPAGPFLRESYDNLLGVRSLSRPLLIIGGDNDRVVPPWMGEALFEAASEPKQRLIIRGAGHDDIPWVGGEPYAQRINEFVDSLSH
ncbi:alpha/beta hydrolase [Acidobacteria bacterium AH-259-D05]|nr:alpha/beta hydrolase [Acidobacteria bacterium AH-259-D05]